MPEVVLSLYDYSGNAVRPWLEFGYDAWIVDLKHRENKGSQYLSPTVDIEEYTAAYGPNKGNRCKLVKFGIDCEWFIGYMLGHFDVIANWAQVKPHEVDFKFMFAFPPCTDLASSGAWKWKEKGPAVLTKALQNVSDVYKLGETLRCPYLIENPVGRLSTHWRKPDYMFHPWEYTGYLDRGAGTNYFTILSEHMTKKTCLWTSDNFVMPQGKVSRQTGGFSISKTRIVGVAASKRKRERTNTPLGFSYGVFEANCETPAVNYIKERNQMDALQYAALGILGT